MVSWFHCHCPPLPRRCTRDIKWLVEDMASLSSTAEAGRRWLAWLKDGLSPPFRESLSGLMVQLRPLFPSDVFGGSSGGVCGGGGGGVGGVEAEVVELLSPARLQSAVWAAEGDVPWWETERGLAVRRREREDPQTRLVRWMAVAAVTVVVVVAVIT